MKKSPSGKLGAVHPVAIEVPAADLPDAPETETETETETEMGVIDLLKGNVTIRLAEDTPAARLAEIAAAL